MGITVAILIVLLQVSVVAGQTCGGADSSFPTFRMFDGNSEVFNFTCNVFTTSSCKHGPSTFPQNLSDGTSVEKPRNFDITGFRRNFTYQPGVIFHAPGATFTWEAPLSGTSRRDIKGFYLKLLRVNSGKLICRLIDLRNVDLTTSVRFRFSYELFPFSSSDPETYKAYLTSLPPPSDQEFEGGLVEKAVFGFQPFTDYRQMPVIYPDFWTTWITVRLHPSKGIIEVRFGFPAPDSMAEFTKFKVQLVNKETFQNAQDETEILRTGSETVGMYNFTNVRSGKYKIQVYQDDLFFNDLKKCQCWKMTNNRRDCGTCKTSRTDYFNFTRDITATTSGPVPPVTTTIAVATTTAVATSTDTVTTQDIQGSLDAVIIIPAVVVPLVALVFLGVVMACLYQRGRLFKPLKSEKPDTGGNNRNENNNQADKADKLAHPIFIVDGNDNEVKHPREGGKVEVGVKKVLLLASDDHELFRQAVEGLARFLQLHCRCQVTFAPQQMVQLRHAANTYCWISAQIDSADFVLIVNSQAALKLYLAFRDGKGYTQAALGPEGDLFTPGIQHICGKIANNEDVHKVLMVSLDHTANHCRPLPISPLASFRYQLPAHLTSFLHHIHNLDSATMDLSQVDLPLKGHVEELEGGRAWLEAVTQCKAYETLHPGWFDLKFGTPTELYPLSQSKPDPSKPDYTQQVSDDSGYKEGRISQELKRRLSSVSTSGGGKNEEADPDQDFGLDNASFSKDDFLAPSIYTAHTTYTVPYPNDERPSEIDERSMTDEFNKVNQHYEEKQQERQQHDPSLCGEEYNLAFSGLAGDPHLYNSWGQTGTDFVTYIPGYGDPDCISVSSAQSV